MTERQPYDQERYEQYVQHERESLEQHISRGLPDDARRLGEIAQRCQEECEATARLRDGGELTSEERAVAEARHDRALAARHMILDRQAGKAAQALARKVGAEPRPSLVVDRLQAPADREHPGQA